MKKRCLTGLMITALGAGTAFAQLTISAELRPRTELRHGFKKPLGAGEDPAFFTEQRTRLNLSYDNDALNLFISAQDVRIWGSVDQVYKSDPSLTNLYEAWVACKLSESWKIKVGRQSLNYDNARILGNLDWAQQGRSHDMAALQFEKDAFRLHAGAAFNQDAGTPEFAKLAGSYYTGVTNYKTMQFLWISTSSEEQAVSFLLLNDGRQGGPDTVNFSQTVGLTYSKNFQNYGLYGQGYYQTGKNAAGHSVSAWALSGGLKLFPENRITLDIGVDWLSGDQQNTERVEAFDPLYGTHHKFYGLMDYFYVGNGHMNKGLLDLYLKTAVKTGSGSVLSTQLHRFFSDQPVGTPEGSRYSSGLGFELDLVYRTSISNDAQLTAGYSQALHSDALDHLKGVEDPKAFASWGWIMLTVSPQIFTVKE